MNPDLYQELVKQINNLQKQVDGLIKPEVGRWIDWTPVITQNVNVTFTKNYARYMSFFNSVILSCEMTVTGAGTAGNNIVISGIPLAPARTGNFIIGAGCISSGGKNYNVAVIAAGVDNFRFIGYATGSYMGADVNLTLAAGNVISFTTIYERA